jgi:hypothetical protein
MRHMAHTPHEILAYDPHACTSHVDVVTLHGNFAPVHHEMH